MTNDEENVQNGPYIGGYPETKIVWKALRDESLETLELACFMVLVGMLYGDEDPRFSPYRGAPLRDIPMGDDLSKLEGVYKRLTERGYVKESFIDGERGYKLP